MQNLLRIDALVLETSVKLNGKLNRLFKKLGSNLQLAIKLFQSFFKLKESLSRNRDCTFSLENSLFFKKCLRTVSHTKGNYQCAKSSICAKRTAAGSLKIHLYKTCNQISFGQVFSF